MQYVFLERRNLESIISEASMFVYSFKRPYRSNRLNQVPRVFVYSVCVCVFRKRFYAGNKSGVTRFCCLHGVFLGGLNGQTMSNINCRPIGR